MAAPYRNLGNYYFSGLEKSKGDSNRSANTFAPPGLLRLNYPEAKWLPATERQLLLV
jgi:hypothetical protein